VKPRSDLLQSLLTVCIGLTILYGGATLTAYEIKVSGIREILRGKASGLPMPSGADGVLAAIQTDSRGGGLAGQLLDHGLYEVSTAGRSDAEAWIGALATTLATRSPLEGKAWCILSIAEARIHGMTGLAAQRLRACYRFAPLEPVVTTWRLSLALATWHNLPADLKTSAMTEIAQHLSSPQARPGMVLILAFAIATLAPNQETLVRSLTDLHGEPVKVQFERALKIFQQRRAKAEVAR
jgi:hypothetical protein